MSVPVASQPYVKPRIRPSGWWYLLIPLVLALGTYGAVVAGIDEGKAIADSYTTLGSDGVGTVELHAGDEATVWAIWDDGRDTDGLSRPPATVVVTDASGAPVTFDRSTGSGRLTFAIGGDSGIDLGKFEAPTDGTYTVKVTYEAGGVSGAVPTAAVGRVDIAGAIGRVLKPLGLAALAALVLLVVLLVLRGASKRRARREAAAAFDPGAAPVTTAATTTSSAGARPQDPPNPQGPITFS